MGCIVFFISFQELVYFYWYILCFVYYNYFLYKVYTDILFTPSYPLIWLNPDGCKSTELKYFVIIMCQHIAIIFIKLKSFLQDRK